MGPGGGMAYAEDLKSSVPNGTCGFDPHPGYQTCIKRIVFRRITVMIDDSND